MSSDFEDHVEQLKGKVSQVKNSLQTDEANRNALVVPFIKSALGYDVLNPVEMLQRFAADQGIMKSEEIDCDVDQNDAVNVMNLRQSRVAVSPCGASV